MASYYNNDDSSKLHAGVVVVRVEMGWGRFYDPRRRGPIAGENIVCKSEKEELVFIAAGFQR